MRNLRVALAGTALLLASCIQGGRTGPADAGTRARLLKDPLQDGTTTREDVVLRLGVPSARFENDRLLCYRLLETPDGMVVAGREAENREPWVNPHHYPVYNLVLVFDARSVLVRHSLLCIRQTVGSPSAGVSP